MERKESVAEATRATTEMVLAAHRGMSRAFDTTRVGVLGVVIAGPARPREIGVELGIAPSSVTRHVQALEDAGQVTVEADPADARTCVVTATAAGRQELADIVTAGSAVFGAVVADWSDEDVIALGTLVDRLTRDFARRFVDARRTAVRPREPRWRHRPEGTS